MLFKLKNLFVLILLLFFILILYYFIYYSLILFIILQMEILFNNFGKIIIPIGKSQVIMKERIYIYIFYKNNKFMQKFSKYLINSLS